MVLSIVYFKQILNSVNFQDSKQYNMHESLRAEKTFLEIIGLFIMFCPLPLQWITLGQFSDLFKEFFADSPYNTSTW